MDLCTEPSRFWLFSVAAAVTLCRQVPNPLPQMGWLVPAAQTISRGLLAPRFFKVDQSQAVKVGEAVLMFGNDRFGAEVVEPLVVMELERRRDEVKATGESAWCSYPRPAMISDGLILLFR